MKAEHLNTIDWQSPYQTAAYFGACKNIGIPCTDLEINGVHYYFYLSGDEYIAWELPASAAEAIGQLPPQHVAHVLREAGPYDGVNWDDQTGYSTVYTAKNDVQQKDECGFPEVFDARFRRSLKKSAQHSLKHGIAETDAQVNEAIELFSAYPERRDGLELDFFLAAVWQWLAAGVVDVHVVMDSSEKPQLLGSAVTLKSPTQANLRYYTAARAESNPGHFLHLSQLFYYLEYNNFQLVDHSGISPPQENDSSLKGITQFKLQIANRVAIFAKLP